MSAVTPEHIMQVGFGFWASKTLLSAVELGVFSALANAPADLPTLQGKLGLHQRSAPDFLDGLVALKLLKRENGIYSNAVDTDLFLDRAKPSYVGGILEMANDRLYGIWGSLTEAVRSGEPQNETKGGGEDIFAALYADPEQLQRFLSAMSGLSVGAAHAIAAKFPWREYKTFLDLGSAQGMVPATIARAYPHLAGIGFDLPPIKAVFEEFIAQSGTGDRVRFRGGNFFEDRLPKVDVVILGHILHDWDLTKKKMLLSKVYDALPNGGAVIVYDAIIDDDRRENVFGLMMSLNMLIETTGGFDYTGEDCQAWMREVGFSQTRVEPLTGPDSMVIGLK
ncbi:methyltransferase (plasmid) [Bradyrhizobium lupini]|uniref:methyltransferase n=1 Tax=Rhizobium lupini TaxID=136996 RepID=UPI00366BF46A